jgi:predicted transcriptional regulator
MKTTTFTSTLSPQLLDWVTTHAKATKQTRRNILEAALTKYRAETIRQKMQADFQLASKDSETLELSEWGIDDYQEIVNS